MSSGCGASDRSSYAGGVKEIFELDGDYIPLCDLLKYCQVTESGGAAKHFIAEGNVRVDGEVELRKARKIRMGQVVSGDGFEIRVV
jgi:ribosome-associated protein